MKAVPIERWDGQKWIEMDHHFNVERDFLIMEEDLDGELCRMGQLMVEYGTAWAELKAQAARHKEEQKAAYAREAAMLRTSGEKMTEARVEEMITAHSSYRVYVQRTNRSTFFSDMLEVWYKSLAEKSRCLNALAFKHGREIQAMQGGM